MSHKHKFEFSHTSWEYSQSNTSTSGGTNLAQEYYYSVCDCGEVRKAKVTAI